MKPQDRQTFGRAFLLWICAATLPLSACGPTRLTIKNDIPPLLMPPLPLVVGVRIPKAFSTYVQKEAQQERQWLISLGPAQAEAMRLVTSAMFTGTVVLGDPAPGDAAQIAAHKLKAILEPSLDSYVYLLPSPNGADFYSATIGYKVNLESVDGTVLGSWVYEGYGSTPSRGIMDSTGVALVTSLAIRDAFANLAAHMPDQELIRDLIAPPQPPAPAPASATASAPAPAAAASTEPAGTPGPVTAPLPASPQTATPQGPVAPTPSSPPPATVPESTPAPAPEAAPAPAVPVVQPTTGK